MPAVPGKIQYSSLLSCLQFLLAGRSRLIMRRDELLAEIARLDEEINRTVSTVELPRIDVRPFPWAIWVFTALCFAWFFFGDRIPGAYSHYLASVNYAWNIGLVCGIVAVLATINWMFRGRGYQAKSDAYVTASRHARELQERRRELQSELKSISAE